MTPNYASVTFKVVLGKSLSDGIDISDRLSSITYKESLKKDNTFDLKANGADAEYLLELAEFDKGRSITFTFGYIGGPMSTPRTLILQDIEPSYKAGSAVSLSATTADKGQAMKKVTGNKLWRNTTTPEVVLDIAKMHGMGTVIEDPDSTYYATNSDGNQIAMESQIVVGAGAGIGTGIDSSIPGLNSGNEFKKWPVLSQGGRTNMEMLQWLAHKEGRGYTVHVQDNNIHFTRNNEGAAASDKITVGQTDNIISVSIKYRESTANKNAMAVAIGGKPKDAKNAQDTPITGVYALDAEFGKISSMLPSTPEGMQKLLKQGTGRTAPQLQNDAQTLEDELSKGLSLNGTQVPGTPNEDETTAGQTATNSWNHARKRVLTCDLSEWGNPLRGVNTVITIEGIATRYSGNWFVESVEHTVGKSYITNSTLNKSGLKTGTVPAVKPNTEPGKEQPKTQVAIVAEHGEVLEVPAGTLYARPFYKGKQTPAIPTTPAEIVPKRIK